MPIETWSDAMQRALGGRDANEEVRARLQAGAAAAEAETDGDPLRLELLDIYDGARDLLRRWQDAEDAAADGTVEGLCKADILLFDFRPIRPYARRLGEQINEWELRLARRHRAVRQS